MELRVYWKFTRPFTLLPPLLGIVSGSVTALGAVSIRNKISIATVFSESWLYILIGALMASCLNAASNCLNQICDIENDRINKPDRVIPTEKLSIKQATVFTVGLYFVALILAWFVNPIGEHQCFWIVIFTAFLTYIYSSPPFRTKRFAILANLTIAIPRGLLLKVAGWSCVATIWGDIEPWFIGFIFFCFLLGAASTKDYSDIPGDKAANCTTMPIKYGIKKSAQLISISFIFPWFLIPVGLLIQRVDGTGSILSGNPLILCILAFISFLYGIYIVYLILKNPHDLASSENHPSWTHMYCLMMFVQIGFCFAYLV